MWQQHKVRCLDSAYEFECLDFSAPLGNCNIYYAVFTPAHRKKSAHQHAGFEFLYVISGVLILEIGPKTHRLSAGDTICFESHLRHSYQAQGKGKCAAIVVIIASQPTTL